MTIKPFVNWQPVYLLRGEKKEWMTFYFETFQKSIIVVVVVFVVCLFLKVLLSN